MVAALGEVDSTHRQYYRRRLVDFEASVDSLEQNIRQQLESCGANRSFLTFHPSWGYFADAFDLEQIAVEIEGKEPGIRELDAIVRRARNKKCGTILLQPQYSQRIAKIIAAKIGATTVIADPLAENWTEQLLHLAKVLCE
jgi:zinc transport system substrate-binding protein